MLVFLALSLLALSAPSGSEAKFCDCELFEEANFQRSLGCSDAAENVEYYNLMMGTRTASVRTKDTCTLHVFSREVFQGATLRIKSVSNLRNYRFQDGAHSSGAKWAKRIKSYRCLCDHAGFEQA